jgi:hypothetical protein
MERRVMRDGDATWLDTVSILALWIVCVLVLACVVRMALA